MTFRHVGACAVLGVALMGVLSAQSTVQSDRQFQAALQKEMVDGDLKGAIAAYGAIASRQGVGRDLAAQALLRMAGCHQKLGDAEAQGIYQRIVRDFPEQADAVALALASAACLRESRQAIASSGEARRRRTGSDECLQTAGTFRMSLTRGRKV